MQATKPKEIATQLHRVEQAIETAPEVVLSGDGTWRPFTGGRMPAGAAKVTVLGTLPRGVIGTTGLPASARIGRRLPANGRGRTTRTRSTTRARSSGLRGSRQA